MRIFAISDLHLSTACDKPMDIFGGNWLGYTEKLKSNWKKIVSDDDLVLVAGDISWAMKLEEASSDLVWIDELPGKKIIIKGNHEYWWKSISSVRAALPNSISAIQNDAIKFDGFVVCGTRGWDIPDKANNFSEEDMKIFKREVERLTLSLKVASNIKSEGDKIICMMHFPPYLMQESETEFTKLLTQYGVSDVVFGHVHGKTNYPHEKIINGVKYHFTSCDQINMTPVLIDEY